SYRWTIAICMTVAIAISYLDRQTLAVAVDAIRQDIPLPPVEYGNLVVAFLVGYALMYAGGGKLIDILGTRTGFALLLVVWSLACASHGFAGGYMALLVSRLALGLGEGGGFPAVTRAVTEWFPVNKRSSAMGMINGGTAVGSVIAPPLIAFIVLNFNWR